MLERKANVVLDKYITEIRKTKTVKNLKWLPRFKLMLHIRQCIGKHIEEKELTKKDSVIKLINYLGDPEVFAKQSLQQINNSHKANSNKPGLFPWIIVFSIGLSFFSKIVFLIAGFFLWICPYWSNRCKIIATCIPLSMAALSLVIGPPVDSTSGIFMRVSLSFLISPIVTAAYLFFILSKASPKH